ncbi:hypothetical protein, partial [Streptomyces sp. NPDC001833]|uniref:hypothetical protein n=1 Tax=Streptomyces sp. NPDC001833 TaxID=3154658 RepID=UPI00333305F4
AIGEKSAPFADVLDSIAAVMFKVVGYVIRVAPLGERRTGARGDVGERLRVRGGRRAPLCVRGRRREAGGGAPGVVGAPSGQAGRTTLWMIDSPP